MSRSKSSVAGDSAALGSPAEVLGSARAGVRVRPFRPVRALVGGLVVVAAVAAALTLYSRIGDRTRVLVLADTVLAGEQISDADLRAVSISSDDDLSTVLASQRASVVGMYARTRLVAGTLLTSESVQASPLVAAGRVLMSVAVPVSEVPVGLREQSRVVLVVTPGDGSQDAGVSGPVLVEAVVAAVPRNLADVVGADTGQQASVPLSVEVEQRFVAVVGSAAAVGVGVVDAGAAMTADSSTAVEDAGPAVPSSSVVPTSTAATTVVASTTTVAVAASGVGG